jgi:hypothetical protein
MRSYKVWQRMALKRWIKEKGKKKGFVVKDDGL